MPLLAGRPPYATDEPDSFYESDNKNPPQRRQRQPPQPNPNDRTSNYDVYDSYFGHDPSENRQSGVGALGLGFLNGSMDDDSDSEEDHHSSNMAPENPFQSKHEALAAATAAKKEQPKKERVPSPKPIAAPKPGYVAPIAALNLAKPEPAAPPPSNPSMRRPNDLQISPSQPLEQQGPPSPHPLQPPLSPITPAFARPRPPKSDVTFAEKGPIIRGDKEETMLPQRGNRGDDFWKRFSMVAKDDHGGTSAWLRKTQAGTRGYSRWVWVIGLVLALCVAGGIGIGWYASHKSASNQQPEAIGGSANEAGSASSSSLKAVGSGTVQPGMATSMHVSPTYTVQRRYVPRAEATALARDEHRRIAWKRH